MTDDDGRAGQLYREVAQQLMLRIAAGQYAVGSVLPREVDFATEFDVSRNTIREALRLLEMDNVIVRRKRVGTIVHRSDLGRTGKLKYDPVAVPGGLSQLTRFVVQVSNRARVPVALIPEAVGPDFANWIHFAGVRRPIGGIDAICVTEFYLHPRLQAATCQVGQEVGLVYGLVERLCGERMRVARSQMVPCRITARQAAEVGVRPGTLGIRIVRRFYNEPGELLEVGVTICPADRISLEISYDLPHPREMTAKIG